MSEDKKHQNQEVPKRPPSNVDTGKHEITTHYRDDGKTVDYEEYTDRSGKVTIKKSK